LQNNERINNITDTAVEGSKTKTPEQKQCCEAGNAPCGRHSGVNKEDDDVGLFRRILRDEGSLAKIFTATVEATIREW